MATISDIAKRAGVSVSTVSHVVNGTRYVSPEKEEKVKKAIAELEKLDQLPNFIVKKKRKEETMTADGEGAASVKNNTGQKYILILLSDQHSLFQDQVRKSLEESLREKGHVAIAVCYDNEAERLERIRTLFLGTGDLDGVIAFPDPFGILGKSFFGTLAIPVVLIGNHIEDFRTDVFLPDTFEGAYKAVEHLAKSGHDKIAFLCEADEVSSHRFRGYQKALEDYGLAVDDHLIYPGLRTEEDVFSAMREITETEFKATALVISDSFPLIPVFKFLNRRNIVVPRDISVVSLNEFEWAFLLNPELTCVDKQPGVFAEKAVRTLLRRIDRKECADRADLYEYSEETLAAHLNIRSSISGIGRGPFGEKAESAELLTLSERDKDRIREKKYTAAISFHYTGKAWMRLQEKGIRKVFDELGISVITVADAHFDADMQNRQLESIKILEPDILISIPVDTKKTAAAFRSIVDSGIKLVLITNIPEGLTPKDYVSCISVNEHSHGMCMGRGLGEYMRKHGLKNAAIFRHGVRDFFATKQRDNAADLALMEEYPDVHICGYLDFLSEGDVYRKTLSFLEQHPETEAIYVSWDGPALKAIEALEEAGRSDIAVVTGDLDYAVAMNMARGGAVKMLSAQCPYEQGEAIAKAAAIGMLGRAVPSFIGVEPISIQQENLLKNWRNIFREEPPAELRSAILQLPGEMDINPYSY